MKQPDSRRLVYEKMVELLKRDKAITTVLPLSKFNLLQLTRQRVRPQIEIKTKEECPSCGGTGKIEASILMIDAIKSKIEYLAREDKDIVLSVHPYLFAYLHKGVYSIKWQWIWQYKKWIKMVSDSNLALTSYHFLDKDKKIITELN